MKHDWNTWLKNRILREARYKGPSNFEFEFEEEELQVGPHLIDVKFIVNADWNEEERQTLEYPGSPAYWDWQIKNILAIHKDIGGDFKWSSPKDLNIPEKEIEDALMDRLSPSNRTDSEMQERLSDEAEKQSPEPDYDYMAKRRKHR